MQDLSIVVQPTPGSITANFDDIKAELDNMMSAYESLEITEDVIKERKDDIAALRKIIRAIEEKRKEVKKTYMIPLDEFEGKVKELTGIINKQVARIDAGLNEFEKERIKEKKETVKKLYLREVGEYAEYIPLDKIYGAKWDNKTCSENEIVSDIQQHVLRVKMDLQAIKGLHSRFEEQLLGAYKVGGITCAMQKHADFVEAEKAVEREQYEKELQKAREEAKTVKVENTTPVTENPSTEDSDASWMSGPVLVIEITGEENIKQAKELLQFSEIPFKEVRA